MAPKPPTLVPPRRSRGAPRYAARLLRHGGPEMAPNLPMFGAPRHSRVAPLTLTRSARGGLSQTEGEANGAIDRHQLDRRECGQALRQRPARNRGDGVEVHHARLRHAVARTEGHLARDLPYAFRERRDRGELL